jgi:hypothetical protein
LGITVQVRLRASIDSKISLPFDVGKEEFMERGHHLPDMGGYEYNPQTGRLIVIAMPGPIHERVITVFSDWFKEIKDNFGQQGMLEFAYKSAFHNACDVPDTLQKKNFKKSNKPDSLLLTINYRV